VGGRRYEVGGRREEGRGRREDVGGRRLQQVSRGRRHRRSRSHRSERYRGEVAEWGNSRSRGPCKTTFM
jgi:hypothetical protein